MKQAAVYAGFFLGLFKEEDGGYMFLRNIRFLVDYMA
jgi:hypothetical protein